ncbi:serine hydrolase domain-containing protein [Spongiimicrobium salis]|uniref:serine hydrolase domain-containing protein n=1 Tax=Spongiimicrobium salis TaxID=1667022 RepID=UPI00374D835F
MQYNTRILLFIVLIINGSFAQQNAPKIPEATAAEANSSFWDIPYLQKAFIDATPMDRKDGIPVGELGVNGGNKEIILQLAQEIADHNDDKFDSFLIAHKGRLLFESYYSRGRVDLPHFQASATKTYTSMALGRAIQLGYLNMADLDKPLISFLKELDPTKLVPGVEKITLHKALTMRSGIHLSSEKREEIEKNPAQIKGQRHLQAFLEHCAPITEASQTFAYKDDPRLVMQVLEAVVPGTAANFIKKELLSKMNITNYEWGIDVSGIARAGSHTSMTSRDMIKWGILAMNKGKWEGEQLVSEAFMNKAIHSIVRQSEDENFADQGNVTNVGYGYFWWQADMKVGHKNYFTTSARGGGGQYIMLIEELDLMIVITAHDLDNNTLQTTAERILPAFVPMRNSTKNGKNKRQDKFPIPANRYLGQKPPGLLPKVFAPKLVSTETNVEAYYMFTPDMKEFYFSRRPEKYNKTKLGFVVKYKDKSWGEPSILSSNIDTYRTQFDPEWSKHSEILKKEPFKAIPITGFSVSSKGTFYFYTLDFTDGSGHMSYSRLLNGTYETPQKMNPSINTGIWIAHPLIAPDESYLIWDAEREGVYGADIYISFKQQDGSWGEAMSMGNSINTELHEQGARLTPDGKYLFFWRGVEKYREDGSTYWTGSPYWVDARIIETLRPK